MTMTLVSTVTVGSGGASTIEFDSIPQTATDLFLVLSMRKSSGSSISFQDVVISFNNDATSANYNTRVLYGNGSTTYSANYTYAGGFISSTYPQFNTANTFNNVSVYIPNYTSSTAKSVSMDNVAENNSSTTSMGINTGRWTGTAAITKVSLTATDIQQYSTASLYTITKGSGGATVS